MMADEDGALKPIALSAEEIARIDKNAFDARLKLAELARPIAELLQREYGLLTKVIIECGSVTVLEEQVFLPVEIID